VDPWEPLLLEEIEPAKLYGFYLKRDKTHYLYLDSDVVLAVPDNLLLPTAEGAAYISISFSANFNREDSIHSGRENIKFFSRNALSELEARTPEEFDEIAERFNDNLVCRCWAKPETHAILIQISRYYKTHNISYKRGVIIQMTEELLRDPPLSDVPEVIIKRNIVNPRLAAFGKE